MTALIEAEALSRTLPAVVPVTLVRDVTLTIGAARVRGDHRPLRLRQVLAALSPRPARPADERDPPRRRPRRRAYERGGALRLAPRRPSASSSSSTSCCRSLPSRRNVEMPMRKLGRFPRRAMPVAGEPNSSSASGSRAISTSVRISCRAGSASGSRSPARSPTTRRWCSPTSRPAASTRRARAQVFAILEALVREGGKTVVAGHPRPHARRPHRPARRACRRTTGGRYVARLYGPSIVAVRPLTTSVRARSGRISPADGRRGMAIGFPSGRQRGSDRPYVNHILLLALEIV